MEQPIIKILIADDEPDILEIVGFHLSKAGYEVITAKDGSEAIEKAKITQPDCIILDIMMPKRNGFEVCEYLRSQSSFDKTLIVLMTALNDETSHIKGLELGGDDFVSKPISPKVLLSRINALFRRIQTPAENNKVITIGNLCIDPAQYKTTLDDKSPVLAKKEFELLYLLAAQPGKVFLRNEILSQVWGNDVIVGDRTIDVHVRKIRVKLGIDCITTVKGVGYKFDY
jgi:two-component system alkaline phosphatase synthesis response regulator PhoP